MRFGADFSAQKVSKDDLVGFDLCVLATSHHSVHTYGTFGLWGSLLAGGDVVVTKGRVEVGLYSVFWYTHASAANRLIGEVVQSRRRPLLGPSPG